MLDVPRGDQVRPATDGMRQGVFSSLAALIPGARFLDLFAGSGAYGLEALSRGASGGAFVEQSAKAVACIRRNLMAVNKSLGRAPGAAGNCLIVQADARQVPPGGFAGVPDVVFVDPPYDLIPEVAPDLFARLAVLLAPKPDAVVVFEMPGELELRPEGWTLVKRLGKGARQPTVAFYRRTPPAAGSDAAGAEPAAT
jgi:16S rRNA (guanine966-N2)-methyltransferase